MNTCTPVKGRVFEGLARQHNGGHLQGSKARHTASPIVLKVGIWKVKLGLSENSVSHIPMDYHQCSPLKVLFVGIPYFQTNPTSEF